MSSSNFTFEYKIGADNEMIEYTKMCILLANSEYTGYYKKAELVRNKFEEKYHGSWSCLFVEKNKGQLSSRYDKYYIYVDYNNTNIIIWNNK